MSRPQCNYAYVLRLHEGTEESVRACAQSALHVDRLADAQLQRNKLIVHSAQQCVGFFQYVTVTFVLRRITSQEVAALMWA